HLSFWIREVARQPRRGIQPESGDHPTLPKQAALVTRILLRFCAAGAEIILSFAIQNPGLEAGVWESNREKREGLFCHVVFFLLFLILIFLFLLSLLLIRLLFSFSFLICLLVL